MTRTDARTYVAGVAEYRYPGAGDETPPGGAKVLLLTIGGVCIVGTWCPRSCVAWAPLPKRDKKKEAAL